MGRSGFGPKGSVLLDRFFFFSRARVYAFARGLQSLLSFFILIAASPYAYAVEENAQSFIYQGRFVNTATNQPVANGNYDLDFKVYDSTKTCLLFHQLHSNVAVTSGFFSVKVGGAQADPTRVGGTDPGLRMADVFANNRTIPVTGCGNVTFGVGDKRVFVVENVDLGTTLPDQDIVGQPSALVAETLQGLRPDQLLLISGNTLPASVNAGTYGIEGATGDVKYHDGVSWSGSTQVLNPSALVGAGASTNQVLKWNGSAWAPANDADSFLSATPGGDISGSFSTMNIAKLQSQTLTLGASPATGDVLTWNGSAWVNSPASGASGAAGGDLAGTYPNPTVDGLQGLPVSSTSPNSGEYLGWNGSSWIPAVVTSISPGGSAGGDLGGTYPNPSVEKIKGAGVSATAPSSASQVLRWDPSGAGAWTPMTIDDLIASSGNTLFVRKSGDTMVGNLVMNAQMVANNTITANSQVNINGNLAFDSARVISMTAGTVTGVAKLNGLSDPSDSLDAVNKRYADVYVAGYTIAGGTVSAGESLKWNAAGYWERFTPATGTGSVTHVGSGAGLQGGGFSVAGTLSIDDNYIVRKAGDTVTGQLHFNGLALQGVAWPSAATEAATKGYADNNLAGSTISGLGALAANQVLKWDGAAWVPSSFPASINTADADARYIARAGDTVSGNFNLDGNYVTNGSYVLNGALTATGTQSFRGVTSMTGDVSYLAGSSVNFGGNVIYNIGTPVAPADAATKAYVDAIAGTVGGGNFVRISGDTMTGQLHLNGLALQGVAWPSAATEAANKGYVDNNLAGSTISGLGALAANQVLKWDGSAWVPSYFPASLNTADADARYIARAGDTITGTFNMYGTYWMEGVYGLKGSFQYQAGSTIDFGENVLKNVGYPTATDDATNRSYVEDVTGGLSAYYVRKSGDTMTGNLVMSGAKVLGLAAPAATDEAVNKQYADLYLAGYTIAGGTVSAGESLKWNAAGYWERFTAGVGSGSVSYVGSGAGLQGGNFSAAGTLSIDDNYVVRKAGDTVTGQLHFGGLALQGVGLPQSGTDAVNRDYANSYLAGSTVSGMGAISADQVLKWTGSYWTPGSIAASINTADADSRYVNVAGDTISGDFYVQAGSSLNLGGNVLYNIGAPVAPADAANKGYVDSVAATVGAGVYVQKTGDTMAGNLTFDSARVIAMASGTVTGVAKLSGLEVPVAASEAVNKQYADLYLAGYTIAGGTVSAGESLKWNAAGYWERFTAGVGSGSVSYVGSGAGLQGGNFSAAGTLSIDDNYIVRKAGDTVTGQLHLGGFALQGVGAPVAATDAANKAYSDAYLAGSTISGMGTIAADQVLKWTGSYWTPGSIAASINTADADARYIARAGDTVSGNFFVQAGSSINLGGNVLYNIGTPVVNADAANKGYVDSQVSGVSAYYVRKSGDTMTGNLVLSGAKVLGLAAPAAVDEAVNKGYADLYIAGATIAGGTVSSGESLKWNAAGYWERFTAGAGSGSVSYVGGGAGILGGNYSTAGTLSIDPAFVVRKAGDTVTGQLHFDNLALQGVGMPSATNDAASKAYVDSVASTVGSGVYVQKAGDTMAGNLTFDAARVIAMTSGTITGVAKLSGLDAPVAATEAVNKQYADLYVAGATIAGGTVSSGESLKWNTAGYWERFTAGAGSLSSYVLGQGLVGAGTTVTSSGYTINVDGTVFDANYVKKSGDSVSGQMHFGGYALQGVGWPSAATHAATKGYADAYLAGATISGMGTIAADQVLKWTGSYWTPGSIPASINTADADARYIARAGDTINGSFNMAGTYAMSGDFSYQAGSSVNLGGNVLYNIGTPVVAADAVNKGYVDSQTSGLSAYYVRKSGDTMTGNLTFDAARVLAMTSGTITGVDRIKGLAAPAADDEAVNRAYANLYIAGATIAGGTVSTGESLKWNAAGYWERFTAGAGSGSVSYVGSGSGILGGNYSTAGTLSIDPAFVVRKAGDTVTGQLHFNGLALQGVGAPVASTDAVNKSYADNFLAGSTVSGLGSIAANQVLQWTGSYWTPASFPASITTADADGRYVNATGDSMSGSFNMVGDYTYQSGASVNMGGNVLYNIGTPVVAADAANKGYVDSQTSGLSAYYVRKTGDTMSGNLIMSGAKVIGLAAPTAADEAVNKGYADLYIAGATIAGGTVSTGESLKWNAAGYWERFTAGAGSGSVSYVGGGSGILGGNYSTAGTLSIDPAFVVRKAGDTVTGQLHLNNLALQGVGMPSATNDAANKAYVDSVASTVGAGVYVKKAGDTIDGPLVLNASAQLNGNLTFDADRVIAMTSGTITGVAKLSGLAAPAAATEAVNKQYADLYIAGATIAGGTVSTGESLKWNAAGYWERFTAGAGSGSVSYVGGGSGILGGNYSTAGTLSIDPAFVVRKAGDTVTGQLHFNGLALQGVGTPVANTDAVNKSYADNFLAGSTISGGGSPGQVLQWTGSYWTGYSIPASIDTAGADARYVNVTGDSMSGNFVVEAGSSLNFSGNVLYNIGTPVAAGDAANKSYVDSQTSGLSAYYVRKSGDTISGNIFMSASSLGIGTPFPRTKFEVVGTTGILVSTTTNDNAAKNGRYGTLHYDTEEEPTYFVTTENSSTENKLHVGGGTSWGNAATQLQFYTASNNTTTGGTERMRIDSSGSVIVTDSSDDNSLTYPFKIWRYRSSATDPSAGFGTGMDFMLETTTNDTLATAAGIRSIWESNQSAYPSSADGALFFSTNLDGNVTEKMRITSAGNVGIGTSAPYSWANLHVIGNNVIESTVDDNSVQATSLLLRSRSSSTAPGAGFGTSLSFVLEGATNNSWPTAGSIQTIWETNQTDDTTARDSAMVFVTMQDNAYTEKVRVTSAGNLGVGTNTPNDKLHVAGGIIIGNTTLNNSGALRWTGTDFEGYNGTSWLSLTQSTAGGGGISSYVLGDGLVGAGATVSSSGATIAIDGALLDSIYVSKAGDTVSGNFYVQAGSSINLGGNVLYNIGTPVVGGDAANKQYVDNIASTVGVGKYVRLAGDTMVGPLVLNANGQFNGNLTFDAARVIAMTSGTITGVAKLSGLASPAANDEAVNKGYADIYIAGATIAGGTISTGESLKWNAAGYWERFTAGAGSGSVSYVGGGSGILGGNYSTAGTLSIDPAFVVRKAGDTVTGQLHFNGLALQGVGWPTAATHAATKGYADNYLAGSTVSGLGSIAANQVLQWTGSYWMPGSFPASISTADADARYVNIAGDTMSGTFKWLTGSLIDAGGNKIVNIGTPTTTGDAVPWEYLTAVSSNAYAYYVKKTGDTVNGDLAFATGKILNMNSSTITNAARITGLAAPAGATEAVNKQYADVYVAGYTIAGGTVSAGESLKWNASGYWERFTAGTGSGSVTYVGGGSGILGGNYSTAGTLSVDPTFVVRKAGDTVTGQLHFNNLVLKGIAAPSITSDAANKQYVDTVASTVGTGKFVSLAGDTMVGGLKLPLGSAAAPSLAFSGDADTGFYSAGADTLSFATGGLVRMTLNTLGSLGIGTETPTHKLDVWGNQRIYGDGTQLVFQGSTTDNATRNGFQFRNNNTAVLSGDDHSNQTFSFLAVNSATRTNDGVIQIFGDEAGGWTHYLQLQHTGTQSNVTSQFGNLYLDAATGTIDMGSSRVINVLDPVASSDAATKNYVDTVASTVGTNKYVRRSGDTMTGHLLVSGTAPTNSGAGVFERITVDESESYAYALVGRTMVSTAAEPNGLGTGIRFELEGPTNGTAVRTGIIHNYWNGTATQGTSGMSFMTIANNNVQSPLTLIGNTVSIGGMVGIGTATPSEKLAIAGNAIYTGNYKTYFNNVTTKYIGAGRNNDLSLVNNTSTWLRIGSGNGISFWASSSADSNDTPDMHLASSGFFGLGTTNPSARLHVDGDVQILDSTGDSNSVLTIGDTIVGAGSLNLHSAGYTAFRIKSAGASHKDMIWMVGDSTRWLARVSSAAETGSNMGSDYQFYRYKDDGTNALVYRLFRNGEFRFGNGTGNWINVNSTTLTGVLTPVNDTDAANKAYVDSKAGGFSACNEWLSAGSFSFTTDASTYVVYVTGVAGGGGGGGSDDGTQDGFGGGGGGGEAVYFYPVNVTPSTGYTVTVGAAGTAGTSGGSPTNGGAGGNSSFGTLLVLDGGNGGDAGNWCSGCSGGTAYGGSGGDGGGYAGNGVGGRNCRPDSGQSKEAGTAGGGYGTRFPGSGGGGSISTQLTNGCTGETTGADGAGNIGGYSGGTASNKGGAGGASYFGPGGASQSTPGSGYGGGGGGSNTISTSAGTGKAGFMRVCY